MGCKVITIGKFTFDSLSEWSSWRKIKISAFIFGTLVGMKRLIELLSIVPTDHLSKMLKQLWLVSPAGSYAMIKARIVASFRHILAPLFGGGLASVLKILTKPEKW